MASTCNKSFSSDYMLLKPEEAHLLEVSKILFSSDIGKRKFVDCPDGVRREPFGRRWIIFLSVMAMKLLKAVSKPLAWIGSGVENWINLLSENGGFFKLLLHSIQGKVISTPDRESEKFVSFIGSIDRRIELDQNIKPEDLKYNAFLSIMAAKISYENQNFVKAVVEDHWKMDFIGSYDYWNDYQDKATTQACLFDDKKDLVVVAFRGTSPFDSDDWSSDVDISWYELPETGKMHAGFTKALGLQKNEGWPKEQAQDKPVTAYYDIRKLLKEQIKKNANVKFIITGHSLGGALAVIFPAVLALHGETEILGRIEGVYTFGQPRVGDEKFGEYMKNIIQKYGINYCRCVYSYDMIPRLPYDNKTQMFKHFGSCIFFSSLYKGKVMEEEPDKNYFSLIWLIPKIVNAIWELIRGFIIPFTKGPDYKEGGVLRMFRIFGLLVAGFPAHCPQDYVNSTRLVSSDVYQKLVKTQ